MRRLSGKCRSIQINGLPMPRKSYFVSFGYGFLAAASAYGAPVSPAMLNDAFAAEALPLGQTQQLRSTPHVMGLGLDDSRSVHRDVLGRIGITREVDRHFTSGESEWRVWLANGVFARLAYAADGAAAKVRAIILTVEPGDVAKRLEMDLRVDFGVPAWQDASDPDKSYRFVWGGRGAPEDAVIPDPGAAIVAELSDRPGTNVSVTLAQPSWFASKR
jgi:hypothetical protein